MPERPLDRRLAEARAAIALRPGPGDLDGGYRAWAARPTPS